MLITSSRLVRRLVLVTATLLVLILLVHMTGIGLIRYFAERELHPALPQGTDIRSIDVNLFTGALEIGEFDLRSAGERRIRAGKLILDVDTWRLFVGDVHIERARLENVYVRVDRRPDGSFELGLPEFAGDDQPKRESGEPIALSLAGVEIADLTLDYRDGEQRSTLQVDELNAGSYALRAATQEIPLDWRMQWDGRRVAGSATVVLGGEAGPAVAGRLDTDPIDLGRLDSLARAGMGLSGEVEFDGDFAWAAPTLTLGGDLKLPQLRHEIAGRKVAVTDADFPGLNFKFVSEPQLLVELTPGDGSRAAAWDVVLEGQQANGRAITLSGKLRYDGGGVIETRDLDYRADSVSWADAGRRVELGGLRVVGTLQQSLAGDTPIPALNADLSAGKLSYTDSNAGLTVQVTDLAIDQLALSQQEGQGARRLAGDIKLAASEITRDDMAVAWSAFAATLGGQIGRDLLDIRTDAALDGLRVDMPQLRYGALSLGRVAARGLAYNDAVRFDMLRLEQLLLPSDPESTTLKVASIAVGDGRYAADNGVALGEIVIDGLQTAVIRDTAGRWRYPMSPAEAPPAEPGAGAQPAAETAASDAAGGDAAMPWRIGGLRVVGDSHLTVADQLNPDMKAPRFAIEKLEIGALASDAPDNDTPFAVLLRPDKYSEFAIDGSVRPLSPALHLKAEGHLHGFAMQAFNGLVANDLGHRFLNGQLDNDFAISLADNQLDMTNALALATVEAEEIPGKEGPPLATAIALLEDRDGNIKLDVPVVGDLSDPQFHVLGALNPIIMKAVAGTAALAIQPLGSVLLVGSLLADQALKVSFDPALFEPGSTSLNKAATDYLDQLAGKLKEKPKLAVKVCGVAVTAERKKNDKGEFADKPEDLLPMAQQRADAARKRLLDQGVGKKQLRACRPAFDAEADGVPRVDIRF